MKFSKGKRQVLPLGRSHILHQYRLRGHLGARELHRSGVLVGTVLNMSLRWTFAIQEHPGLHQGKCHQQAERGDPLPRVKCQKGAGAFVI